jgi:hypothetical protein
MSSEERRRDLRDVLGQTGRHMFLTEFCQVI